MNQSGLTWGGFFIKNLLPDTIGNIIGGALFLGIFYWMIFLLGTKPSFKSK